MKKYIRFDSIGGASGDMILAALTSIGANLKAIEEQLNLFFPEQLHIKSEDAADSGLNGIKVSVHSHHHTHDDTHWPDAEHGKDHTHHHHHHHHHAHRGLKEISKLITDSKLSQETKQLSIAIFTNLAKAEAKIHGKTVETVHFHEVGAWDSVADIVGSCIALEQLDVSGISCSALPSGTGTITCQHGVMPNPAPATQELLEGMPTTQTDEPFELVTPTGAAILKTWLNNLEQPPTENITVKNGFGFGSRRLNNRPNVLRATLLEASKLSSDCELHREGEAPAEPLSTTNRELTILESNLDDCNPEWLGTLLDNLLESGALDVWHTPIIMKKGRPAIKLSVLTDTDNEDKCRTLIYRSTTTFGIRSYRVERSELDREFIEVETEWGKVPVKCGKLNGEIITLAPEHEACLQIACKNGVTVKEVSTAASLRAEHKKRPALKLT